MPIFVVITGGPSVGKTTIISLLQERGYTVVTEIATQVIKEGVFLPWKNLDEFQKEVLRRQMEIEKEYEDRDEIIFLDRGAFDGEAYYLNAQLEIPQEFENVDSSVYQMAFLIEELPFFDRNDVRHEDLEFTRRITPMIEERYLKRNIPVVRVPAMPAEPRVDFVIHELQKAMKAPAITVSYVDNPAGSLVFAS